MAEIINLNRARKDREAALKKALAAANRRKHGRTKAETSLTEAEAEQRRGRLDAHRIDRDDDPDPASY